uniref:Uncharacterized protein n=1 Tax=Arundo donax TaxID=35708 RepID=A0A0A9E5I5_ARUDO
MFDPSQSLELPSSILICHHRPMDQHLHGNLNSSRKESPIHRPKSPFCQQCTPVKV